MTTHKLNIWEWVVIGIAWTVTVAFAAFMAMEIGKAIAGLL